MAKPSGASQLRRRTSETAPPWPTRATENIEPVTLRHQRSAPRLGQAGGSWDFVIEHLLKKVQVNTWMFGCGSIPGYLGTTTWEVKLHGTNGLQDTLTHPHVTARLLAGATRALEDQVVGHMDRRAIRSEVESTQRHSKRIHSHLGNSHVGRSALYDLLECLGVVRIRRSCT